MKRILAIAASIALVFAMTSCNNQTSMEKKTTPNPENAAKAQQFIKDAGSTYYLATAETNGQAHVRAFGTADIFEGKLYIQTGKVKNVYKTAIVDDFVDDVGHIDVDKTFSIKSSTRNI